jgi:hypothetical protein
MREHTKINADWLETSLGSAHITPGQCSQSAAGDVRKTLEASPPAPLAVSCIDYMRQMKYIASFLYVAHSLSTPKSFAVSFKRKLKQFIKSSSATCA